MKKKKPVPENTILHVLAKINSRFLIKSNFLQIEVTDNWENAVGKLIARHTTNIRVVKDVLYVSIENATIKNELHIHRSQVIANVNAFLKSGEIKKIFIQ